MTTMADFRIIREMEDLAARLGFKIQQARHDYQQFCICPAGEKFDGPLPIYSRDAEIMSGDAQNLILFMRGWARRDEYLKMLGATSLSKITKKEQDYRNKHLKQLLIDGEGLPEPKL